MCNKQSLFAQQRAILGKGFNDRLWVRINSKDSLNYVYFLLYYFVGEKSLVCLRRFYNSGRSVEAFKDAKRSNIQIKIL